MSCPSITHGDGGVALRLRGASRYIGPIVGTPGRRTRDGGI